MFHYPPTYTPAELAADRAAISSHLKAFIGQIGELKEISRIRAPAGTWWSIGFGGGDIPYWSSHPSLSRISTLNYEAMTTRGSKEFFSISFVRASSVWEIRTFTYQIATSNADAAERMIQFKNRLQIKMVK